MDETTTQLDDVDLAVAAYRQAGRWVVQELTLEHCEDVEVLADALRRLDGETGAIGLVSVDEDFFVIVRVEGERTRVLLSDASAAEDWDLAETVIDLLDEIDPDDLDERDEDEPAGDLGLLSDLGVSEDALEELLDDPDAYPDEVLSDVARLIGFGEQFDDVAGLAPA
ncbi:tRNA adenosine deaminase-associated protein [Nocardioides sp.]|uniref:tRNA adenosine deaminase-associated protein n=1 Tax=Nocardioides sp. TaxID=35761 RepID=UPI00263045AA|nr:tRNA adenosine deaminase-associated protein [Nocardioides sp.]